MIEKLTPKQEKNIKKTRDRYLARFYDRKNADIPISVYHEEYRKLYKFIGKSEPKQVIVMDSPLGVQLAYNLLGPNLGENLVGNLRENLGANLGGNLGENLGMNLRANLGGNLRANLVGNLGANLEGNLWANLVGNLRENLVGNLRDNLRANLVGNLRANLVGNLRENLVGNLRENLVGNLRDNLGENLRDNLGENLWMNLRDNKLETSFSCWGESTDYFWVAHFMYVIENFDFMPKDLSARLKEYNEIIWTAPTMLNALFKNVAIVSRTPIRVTRDTEGRLHNDEGQLAVEFKDGWGLYAINGVIFNDAKLYRSIIEKTITADEVIKIANTEQRMIALKYLSFKEFVKTSNAQQIGKATKRGNELWRGKIDQIGNVYFLRFSCPSTGREYVEFTNPVEFADEIRKVNGEEVDIYDPDVLQAFAFVFESQGKREHMSLKEYLSLNIET